MEQVFGADIPLAAKAGDRVVNSVSAHFAKRAYRGACQLVGFCQAELHPFGDFTLVVFERQRGDYGCFRYRTVVHGAIQPHLAAFAKSRRLIRMAMRAGRCLPELARCFKHLKNAAPGVVKSL
jgi:hypothetical protein